MKLLFIISLLFIGCTKDITLIVKNGYGKGTATVDGIGNLRYNVFSQEREDSTDNTEIIQKVINELNKSWGGEVHSPIGSYPINESK